MRPTFVVMKSPDVIPRAARVLFGARRWFIWKAWRSSRGMRRREEVSSSRSLKVRCLSIVTARNCFSR